MRSEALRDFFRERHPTQLIAISFALVIILGAGLLELPVATAGPGSASLLTAFFTSTSAICVTGLVVVDTPTYWSHFGQAVIEKGLQPGEKVVTDGQFLLGPGTKVEVKHEGAS